MKWTTFQRKLKARRKYINEVRAMAKVMEGQQVKFGDHVLVIKARKSGMLYARCVDTCCSDAELKIAVKMPVELFIKLADHLNYKQALSNMNTTLRSIVAVVHGPSQQQIGEEHPAECWEKQCLVMED